MALSVGRAIFFPVPLRKRGIEGDYFEWIAIFYNPPISYVGHLLWKGGFDLMNFCWLKGKFGILASKRTKKTCPEIADRFTMLF